MPRMHPVQYVLKCLKRERYMREFPTTNLRNGFNGCGIIEPAPIQD
ncbi:MAG: hypothetical protein ACTSUE_03805 [Promethearchaeota archaeon]